MADLWTDSVEEWQYVVFINKLYRRVTKPRTGRKRLWKAAAVASLASKASQSAGGGGSGLSMAAVAMAAARRKNGWSRADDAADDADADADADGADEGVDRASHGVGASAWGRCFRVPSEVTPIPEVEIEEIRTAPEPPPEVAEEMAAAMAEATSRAPLGQPTLSQPPSAGPVRPGYRCVLPDEVRRAGSGQADSEPAAAPAAASQPSPTAAATAPPAAPLASRDP